MFRSEQMGEQAFQIFFTQTFWIVVVQICPYYRSSVSGATNFRR
jgi:hypothetical protein